MIDAGLVAVIIKVAGIGLTEKHLGKTLAEMQPTLVKLVRFSRCSADQTLLTWDRTHYMDRIFVVKEGSTRP